MKKRQGLRGQAEGSNLDSEWLKYGFAQLADGGIILWSIEALRTVSWGISMSLLIAQK